MSSPQELESQIEGPEKQSYQDQLGVVLNKSLTPKNINSYADDALDRLVEIVDKVVSDYQTSHRDEPHELQNLKQVEDDAFKHYGLTGLDNILGNVARLSNVLSRFDELIATAQGEQTTILGTDKGQLHTNEGGEHSFHERKLIPRLKTILFVLFEDFDIDAYDKKKAKLTPGVLKPGTIRKKTYYSLEVYELDKTLLVCDEEDNLTFVLNSAYLEEHGISHKDMMKLSKPDLVDLIKSDHKFGVLIRYSDSFVNNISNALNNENNTVEAPEREALYPKAPEGYLSMQGLIDKLGVDRRIIDKAVVALGEQLGEIEKFIFYRTAAPGYSPEQIDMITDYLIKMDLLKDRPPEGYLSAEGIADLLGVSPDSVKAAAAALVDKLGDVQEYKFGANTTSGYSPEQIGIISDYLEAKGLLSEKAPEGYMSERSLLPHLKVGRTKFGNALAELMSQLGEVKQYKFGPRPADGYSPEQIEMIAQYLESQKKAKIGSAAITSSNDM